MLGTDSPGPGAPPGPVGRLLPGARETKHLKRSQAVPSGRGLPALRRQEAGCPAMWARLKAGLCRRRGAGCSSSKPGACAQPINLGPTHHRAGRHQHDPGVRLQSCMRARVLQRCACVLRRGPGVSSPRKCFLPLQLTRAVSQCGAPRWAPHPQYRVGAARRAGRPTRSAQALPHSRRRAPQHLWL
jgi:hypothetical protein